MIESPSRLPWDTVILFVVCLLSAALYYLAPTLPLCLVPGAGYLAYRFLPLFGEKADQIFLLLFLILSFVVDDISQVAWGRNVDTITEELGAILFKSFGISGLEAFGFAFAGWLVLASSKARINKWVEQGVIPLLLVSFGIFFASSLAGYIGMKTGGNLKVHFIQTRFLHILPFYAFIGFVVMHDQKFIDKVIWWITVTISAKSFQAVFVYFTHKGIFDGEEYLVDHYYSAFAVLGFVGLVKYFLEQRNAKIRALIVASMGAVLLAYFKNDRRTSYVGVVFTFAMLPVFLPFNWFSRFLPKIALFGGLFGLYTAATWTLEPPLGLVGSTYRSFGNEEGEGAGPSYRDLENANLLNAVTQAPLTGIGYGKEFDERFKMPDISMVYERYRMIPHNLFLASWAFGGPLNIAATSLLFVFMIGVAGQVVGRGPVSPYYWLGMMTLFYLVQYLCFTFGDLGLQIQRNQMVAGVLSGACYRMLKQGQWRENA